MYGTIPTSAGRNAQNPFQCNVWRVFFPSTFSHAELRMCSNGERAHLEREPARYWQYLATKLLMNSPDTTAQIQAIEIEIEKLVARQPLPGDGTATVLASQMMQKDNLQKDLMQQVKLNQDQMIRGQMEQARLRNELAQKEQLQQARLNQEQTQRDQQTKARQRQEQIQRYEKEQARLKQEQTQRDQLEQARRRQEQMQREQLQQARMRQEQIQRQQQMQARLKQEQMQREKARQEQMQKERVQQEKLRQEQAQKELLLAARLKEERSRINQLKQTKKETTPTTKTATHIIDKKTGKLVPKTPEQLAKDEEARAFSSRTEMSLTSIAFCSPLMLFGMGAAMSIFDNFSGKSRNPALLEARRKSQQQMELTEYACRQADKKFNEMVERNNLTNNSNLSNVTDVNATKFTSSKSERAEQKPKINRFIAAEPAVVARKNDSLEVKKLWKERQRLLEHLERVRGQGSLALVSKLVSQLETLDRSLKRLGCDPQA